jgi:hypothetical protein
MPNAQNDRVLLNMEGDWMLLEDIELKILRLVVEGHNELHRGIGNDIIAKKLSLDPEYVTDILVMLDDQGYLHVEQMSGGYSCAFPTSKGRLMITDPEYMEMKLNGSIVLNALSEAIQNSKEIPESNKTSLLDRLKEIKDDPYMSSIGSGLIVEALKKLIGL